MAKKNKSRQATHTLHEEHMHEGQSCFFTLDEAGQLQIRPGQQYWLEAHRHKSLRLLDPQPDDYFLDMGCGEGYLTLPLAFRVARSLGLDFAASALSVLKNQVDFPAHLTPVQSEGDHLPVVDGQMDKLLCNHVLEHVIDDDALLAEMYRILRPGGLILIGVPLAFSHPTRLMLRLRRWLLPRSRTLQLEKVQPGQLAPELVGKQSHIRFYSLSTLHDLLERNGFRVLRAEGVGLSMRGFPTLHRLFHRTGWLFKAATVLASLFPALGDGILILAMKKNP